MTNKTKKFWDVVGQVIASILDLNPEAASRLGLQPPFLVDARWRWA